MAEIEIISSVPAHVHQLSRALRKEDERECVCLGFAAHRILWRSFKHAVIKKTAFVDGRIAAMWGVGGVLLGQTGRPWLLTSSEVEKVRPLTFARIYRNEVSAMLDLFPSLENFVDASYEKSVRMLEIIGFQISEPAPLGKHGALFRRFWMEA